MRRASLPPRVNKNEWMRPKEFAEIKPNRATRNDEPVRPCLRPLRTACTRMEFLFPDRPRACECRNQNERNKVRDIAPSNSPSPPPDTQREHAGQHHRGRFAHDRQGKEQKRPTKTPPAQAIARFPHVHFQKTEDREKVEQTR